MDLISELPEALLLRILSFLPTTEDAVATMVLSKRWQFLWMMVPKLLYNDGYRNIEYGRFSRFVDRSLLLHEAPVLETVHFKLDWKSGAIDIGIWTRNVVKRCVRELIIEIVTSFRCTSSFTLPTSLYTCCKMLATLKLNDVVLADAPLISFPSLRTLSLVSVKYPGDEFVNRLLSNCPVLEDLAVEHCPDDNVTVFTVRVSSLKKLLLHTSDDGYENEDDGFVIDAPSLDCLDIVDWCGGVFIIENDMPNIVTASVTRRWISEKTLGSITSVKRLTLCSETSKNAYPIGSVFHRLEHLEICTCEPGWLNFLMCLLRDSPNLQTLKIDLWECHEVSEPRPCWSEPSIVPECVLSRLETVEWVEYEGAEEEKELVAFILGNAKCLKKAVISSNLEDLDEKLEMLKGLSYLLRCSSSCHLVFE